MSTDRIDPPTTAETQQAIDRIGEHRPENATAALQSLAMAVIEAVRRTDRTYNLSAYFKSLTLSCDGEGNFTLDVTETGTANMAEVAHTVKTTLVSGNFDKPLRPIILGWNNGS